MQKTNPKVAIVTGGRRGIGKAICLSLAAHGYGVLSVDLEKDGAAQATLNEIQAANVPAAFLAADVGDERNHATILEAASELGTVTTLVNNAGVSSTVRGDMLDLPVESFDRAVRINLRAPFLLSQAFAKFVGVNKSEGSPFRSIVNITSLNATVLGLDRPDYCITKCALSMATRLFAARLSDMGIHVYEIRPGFIMTEMIAPARAKYDRMTEDGLVPLKRWGQPDDVGAAVAAFANGAFRFSTGDALYVDGGLNLYRV